MILFYSFVLTIQVPRGWLVVAQKIDSGGSTETFTSGKIVDRGQQ